MHIVIETKIFVNLTSCSLSPQKTCSATPILGLQKGEQQLIIRLLNRRVGEIDSSLIAKVKELSVEQLEELGEALLDFTSVADLEYWFQSGE